MTHIYERHLFHYLFKLFRLLLLPQLVLGDFLLEFSRIIRSHFEIHFGVHFSTSFAVMATLQPRRSGGSGTDQSGARIRK